MDARDDFDGPTGALATIGAGGIMSAADAAGASLSVPIPFQSKIVLVEDARVAALRTSAESTASWAISKLAPRCGLSGSRAI